MISLKQMNPDMYQQTEVGLIPLDWDVYTLGELSELTSSKRIFESDYVNDGVPFYRGQEISSLLENKEIDKVIFISKRKYDELKSRYGAPKPGEILITAVGTLGNAFLIRSEEPFYFKDGNLIWARKIKNCSPEYLINQLNYNKKKVIDCAIGSSQKALTMVSLSPLPFAIPNNSKEQTAIANALSDVDSLINELEGLIEKKQAIKTATMQQLLTGKTRLPQFARYTEGEKQGQLKGMKDSELGEIPEDWEVYFLEQLITSTQLGGNYSNSETESNFPLIKMGNLGRGKIKLDKLEYANEAVSAKDRLKFDDVLFNTRNTLELVGKVAIWKGELEEAYFNSNIMKFVFNSDLVSSNSYMNAALNTKKFVTDLAGIATGTTSVAAIYTRDLLQLKLLIPPKEEQTAIATILSDMDEEIQALMKRLAKTRQIKQGMMQELLTGRTRLPFNQKS